MKKPSALIIDDDQLFRTVIETMILPHTDLITSSPNAENGMYFVSSERPDFIFLDNQLPRLNGNEVVELYKEISPESQIILMSGAFKMDEVADAIEHKVDHVVTKRQLTEEKIAAIFQSNKKKEEEIKKMTRSSLLPLRKRKNTDKRKMNIAIVDDDELFSFGLNWVLNKMKRSNSEDCFAVYPDAKSFYTSFQVAKPDIVFLDYYLEETTAKTVLEHLKQNAPEAKVLIVSSQDDPVIALELSEMNIYGYIIKSENWKERLAGYVKDLAI